MMNENLIYLTEKIYTCAQELELKYYNIEYPELFIFSKNLTRFFYLIGEAQEDDYWKERKRNLKRLVFLFTSAPLDKTYLLKKLNEDITFFENDINNCERLYPNYLKEYKALIEAMKLLLATDLGIIKSKVDEIVETLDGSTVILAKDTKLITYLEDLYCSQNIQIISINSLRTRITYDNIFIIGPASSIWFPDFIFSSPRAKHLFIIKYSWIKGSWQPNAVFLNPIISTDGKRNIPEEDLANNDGENIEPELFLPTIDFSSIISNAWEEVEKNSEEEYVEAIIGYLENDQIVFLDYDDSSTIRIIDVEDEETPVKKIKVKELTPDMFVLLKTSGGGDYIVPLADRILGIKSFELRNTQKNWKNRLRKIKNEMGTDCLNNELISRGCSIANPMNLRNWMSYRSIKTNKFSHFRAILDVIGMNDQAQEIWRQMSLITQAHIKAGQHVTKLLLKMVKEADLNELMNLGLLEFELLDKDAGSITAYRIKALSDRHKTVFVSPTKIGIPMDIE